MNQQCKRHPKEPEGYIQRAIWASRMSIKHEQVQCAKCNLWHIWVKKQKKLKGGKGSTERINPMYGQITGIQGHTELEQAIYRPSLASVLNEIKETQEWLRGYLRDQQRNKWVQEIKRNYRRNKRKRMRCKPK